MGELVTLADYRPRPGSLKPKAQQTYARVNWRPSDLKLAMQQADSGDLQMVGDWAETLLTDDRIRGVMDTRTLALLALPLSFVGDQDIAAELEGDGIDEGWWEILHPESEVSQLVAYALIVGIGFARKVALEEGGHTLEWWHPRWFSWRQDTQTWWVQTADSGYQELDDNWVVFAPYGNNRPWAKGLWRGLAFAWLLKQFALLDRSRNAEVHGSPMRIGVADAGATERQRKAWSAQLKALGRDTAMVLPPGYDLKLLEATAKTHEVYQAQVSWADTAITVIIAGQTVTTEGSAGFSDGKVQQSVAASLVRFTATALSRCLRRQSLASWVEERFPGKVAPRPVWDTETNEERLARARSFLSLGEAVTKLDAALAPSGVRVDTSKMVAAWKIPVTQAAKSPAVVLAPGDIAAVCTVNEARAQAGLDPLPGPEGNLTLEQYRSKTTATPPAATPGAESPNAEAARAVQQREQDAAITP